MKGSNASVIHCSSAKPHLKNSFLLWLPLFNKGVYKSEHVQKDDQNISGLGTRANKMAYSLALKIPS